MLSRGVALATIFGAVLTACALDTSGTIVGESTGSGGSASGASGPGASGPGGAGASGGSGAATSTSSTGPGPGGTGGGPNSCDPTSQCLPSAEGYALLLPQGAACPGGWTDDGSLALSNDTDIGCINDCSCGAASGGSCSPGALYMGDLCSTVFLIDADPPSGCANLGFNAYRARIDAPKVTPGTCPSAGGGKVPIEQRQVCRIAPVGTCDGGSCVPSVPEGELCFPSATDCPDGWDDRSLYPVAADQRDCSCSCGAAAGSCSGSATVYELDNCPSSGDEAPVPMDGSTCVDPPWGSIESLFIDPGTWSGACNPALAEGGPVEYGEAVRLCCPD